MNFSGHYLIAASREATWAALNDAEMLKAAIPGCDRIAWTGSNTLDVSIKVNFGPLHPTFHGDLTLSDIDPGHRYTLSGRGKGGFLGLAHGAADVTLADVEGGTDLRFAAIGGASGQIMKLGKALIGNSAQRVIDGFFERFAAAMGVGIITLDPSEAGTRN